MRWSIRLGRLLGVPVYLHLTFLLLLGWIALSALFSQGLAAAIYGVITISAVFGCVLLHEFGHVLAARRYGIVTRDVTLWPIGGVAKLERMPSKPSQELVVALAGPAVNIAIASVLFPLVLVTPYNLLLQLLVINVALAVFNMIPAFPMDGGRVLRALLAMRGNYLRATVWAATIGRGFAILIGLIGLFGIPNIVGPRPVLILIAFFVWSAGARELLAVRHAQQLGWQPAGTWTPPVIDSDWRN